MLDLRDGQRGDDVLDGGDDDDWLEGGREDDLLTGGDGEDTYAFDLYDNTSPGTNDGSDTISGWEPDTDVLDFTGVTGAGDLAALNSMISSVVDNGVDVTVTFDNGASILFAGAGGIGADELTDLVGDASQIVTST